MIYLTSLLAMLCTRPGLSGDESAAAERAMYALKEYCPDAHISHGNVVGTFGSESESAPHVLLDAHLDQVGLIVTSVTDDGFVTVGNIGGLHLPELVYKNICALSVERILQTSRCRNGNRESTLAAVGTTRATSGTHV